MHCKICVGWEVVATIESELCLATQYAWQQLDCTVRPVVFAFKHRPEKRAVCAKHFLHSFVCSANLVADAWRIVKINCYRLRTVGVGKRRYRFERPAID